MSTTTKQIQWAATKDEYLELGVKRDRMSLHMDLEAAHCNGCKLDLDRLLAFPNFDFVHDVVGVVNHLNRETGKLEDCFLPRCAKPSSEVSNG